MGNTQDKLTQKQLKEKEKIDLFWKNFLAIYNAIAINHDHAGNIKCEDGTVVLLTSEKLKKTFPGCEDWLMAIPCHSSSTRMCSPSPAALVYPDGFAAFWRSNAALVRQFYNGKICI